MNELQIFNNPECDELRQLEDSLKGTYLGVIYAVEFGNMLKIGHTSRPYTRMRSLEKIAEYGGVQIGRVCVSIAHTNHAKNETKLLVYFAPNRKEETELFDIELNSFVAALQSGVIEFLDESEKLKERDKAFFDGMKKFVLGEFNQCLADQSVATEPELLETADRLAAAVQERVQVAAKLTEGIQDLTARVEALEDAVTDPFRASPAAPAPLPAGEALKPTPPGREYMRRWMRTTSKKLNLMSRRLKTGSNAILHQIYGYIENHFDVVLAEERLATIESYGLDSCSTLKAVFYNEDFRGYFERTVDANLAPENRGW